MTVEEEYGELLQSFTEPGRKIRFHEGKHTYTDMDTGKQLTSATTFIKKYKKPFDSVKIAKKCESQYNWGVDYKEILNLWQNNGDISSSLGTSLHLALEIWCRNKDLGAKIKEKTGRKENPALPKHPLLRNLILGFEEINIHKHDYEVVPEAFMSWGNYCGLVDLLYVNEVQRTIRIGDYKFNVDAYVTGKQQYLGAFDHLPTNKISGYQLQMSFYAALLKKAGWNVLGLDAYIYEHGWKHESLPVLDNVIDLDKENYRIKDKEETMEDIIAKLPWEENVEQLEIVNVKDVDGGYHPCHRGTVLGNPFVMKKEEDRDKVCDEYKEYLNTKLYVEQDQEIMDEVLSIASKVKSGEIVKLGCYCAPKRCHCESIREEIVKILPKI